MKGRYFPHNICNHIRLIKLQALYNKYTFVFIYLNYNLNIRASRWAVHGAPKASSFRPNPLGAPSAMPRPITEISQPKKMSQEQKNEGQDGGQKSQEPRAKSLVSTTYSPLCKTKNAAAHFGCCKTTLAKEYPSKGGLRPPIPRITAPLQWRPLLLLYMCAESPKCYRFQSPHQYYDCYCYYYHSANW